MLDDIFFKNNADTFYNKPKKEITEVGYCPFNGDYPPCLRCMLRVYDADNGKTYCGLVTQQLNTGRFQLNYIR